MSKPERKTRVGRSRGAELLEHWLDRHDNPTLARSDLAAALPGRRRDGKPGMSVLTLFKLIWGDKSPSDEAKRRIETFTGRFVRPADWFEPANGKPTARPELDRMAS